MVALPPIDIPTAIVAALLTFSGSWLKEEHYRRKQGREEVIDWYQGTITICERIEHSCELGDTMGKFRENSVSDLYDGVDIEEMIRETRDNLDEDEIERLAEEIGYEAATEISETAESKLVDNFSEHYVNLREHIVNRPRGIDREPDKMDELLTNLWGIQVGFEASSNLDLKGREFEEYISSIISECEKEIDKIE